MKPSAFSAITAWALRGRFTIADYLVQTLRTAIQNGELAAGTELSQVNLARHFSVSRVPSAKPYARVSSHHTELRRQATVAAPPLLSNEHKQ